MKRSQSLRDIKDVLKSRAVFAPVLGAICGLVFCYALQKCTYGADQTLYPQCFHAFTLGICPCDAILVIIGAVVGLAYVVASFFEDHLGNRKWLIPAVVVVLGFTFCAASGKWTSDVSNYESYKTKAVAIEKAREKAEEKTAEGEAEADESSDLEARPYYEHSPSKEELDKAMMDIVEEELQEQYEEDMREEYYPYGMDL